MMQKILFKGEEYIMPMFSCGPIATPEQYRTGAVSFAYLREDGKIVRFGKQIGTKEDIVVLGETEDIVPKEGALTNVVSQILSIIYPK